MGGHGRGRKEHENMLRNALTHVSFVMSRLSPLSVKAAQYLAGLRANCVTQETRQHCEDPGRPAQGCPSLRRPGTVRRRSGVPVALRDPQEHASTAVLPLWLFHHSGRGHPPDLVTETFAAEVILPPWPLKHLRRGHPPTLAAITATKIIIPSYSLHCQPRSSSCIDHFSIAAAVILLPYLTVYSLSCHSAILTLMSGT